MSDRAIFQSPVVPPQSAAGAVLQHVRREMGRSELW